MAVQRPFKAPGCGGLLLARSAPRCELELMHGRLSPWSQKFHVVPSAHGCSVPLCFILDRHHIYGTVRVLATTQDYRLVLPPTQMLPRHLLTLVVGFLLQDWVLADSQQSLLTGDLTAGHGKKEQVQDVLEHEPVKYPACEQFVSIHLIVPSCVISSQVR